MSAPLVCKRHGEFTYIWRQFNESNVFIGVRRQTVDREPHVVWRDSYVVRANEM
jgi:hypothetical protein